MMDLEKINFSRRAAEDVKRIKFGTQELMKKSFTPDFLDFQIFIFLCGLCAFA